MSKLIFLAALIIVGINAHTFGRQYHSTMLADPQQCIEEKCPNEWAACQKDSKCIPTLQNCEKKCGTKSTCWELCLSKAGDQNAVNVAKCASANNCLKSEPEEIKEVKSTALVLADPQQCIEEKCPNEWAACQKDSKCIPTLQNCEKKCGTKSTCWELCLSKAGDQNAVNVAKCASANNCLKSEPEEIKEVKSTALVLADPQQCIEEKCPNEWAACQKDSKCIPTLQNCEKKCGTKSTCWELCLSKAGDQNAVNVAKCADKNNCLTMEEKSTAVALADPQQCIEEKCSTQWAACQKDPKCIPALQDCEKKCGTKPTCWSLCLPSKGSQAAVDVAKCAQSNHCLSEIFVHPFELCMAKSCAAVYSECVDDEMCRFYLRKCRIPSQVWNF